MRNFILIICLLTVLSGCKKVESGPASSYHSALPLIIKNQDGTNLFDPNVEGHLDLSKLNHYYVIDGKKVLQYHEHLDKPKMLGIGYSPNLDEYGLVVHLNIVGDHGSINTSIIEYEGLPADTIRGQVSNSGNLNIAQGYSKIWINGVERDHLVPIVLIK